MKKYPKTYNSCSDMPIYNFMMCLTTLDYSYLVSNKNKISEKKLNDFISTKGDYLAGVFDKIETEYKELTFSDKEVQKHKELSAMMVMEIKHNTIIKIINVYLDTKEIEVLEILNKLGMSFDRNKDINTQLNKAKNIAIGLKNKLNIKTANFKIKYNISDDELEKEKREPIEDVEKSLDSQALAMESNLETGYEINVRKTSVLRWVNLTESNARKLDQLKKMSNG